MKQLLTLVTGILMISSIFAQSEDELYLKFEFMHVDEEQASEYLNIEKFWSGIHQERVNANEIIGWDLWSLEPGGEDQGYQYVTVTLFSSFKDLIAGESDFLGHAKDAYPDKSEEELIKTFKTTATTRDLGLRMYMLEIDETDGSFDMPLGTMASMDLMKALNDDYESIESAIFKPTHQEAVDFVNSSIC